MKWRASKTQTKTGCMYHPAELYSGRNTWDSYSAGGPNKGQWAPVHARPWSHTQRLQEGRKQPYHSLSSRIYSRGDRTINHVPDKGISKGHSQLLRIWDGKEVQFEVQNWHHNSIHSFHIRDGINNGYLPGPEERYANWQNNNGGPRLHRNNRELQGTTPERWAHSDPRRSFPDRMVNNRTGPWKRPALHQRREQAHHHSPHPEHPLIPRDECPAKRRRDLGPDQACHTGSRHLPLLAHAPSPPHQQRSNQDDWKPPSDRAGPCHYSEHRTSTKQQQVSMYNLYYSSDLAQPLIPNLVFHFCRKPLNCELGNTASVTQCHPTRAAAGGHRIMEAEGRSNGKSHLHQQTTPVCLTATNTITITINGTQASLEHLSTTPHYTLWRIRTLGTIITNKAQRISAFINGQIQGTPPSQNLV